MSQSNFFESHYFFELSRRDSLNSSLVFPVGLVTLLASAIVYMFPRIGRLKSEFEWTLFAFLVVGAICLLISIFFLVRAYWGYTYKSVSYLDALHAHRLAWVEHFKLKGKSEPEAVALAEEQFAVDMSLEYARCSTVNARNNDSKSSRIFLANSFVVGAIVAVIFAGPAYGVLSFLAPAETHRVRIVNPQEINMSSQEPKHEPAPALPVQPAPEPPRPVMPPSRDIREHVDPGKQQ